MATSHLAFDLGGTRLKAGLVVGGEVITRRVADVAGLDVDAALAELHATGHALLRDGGRHAADLAGVGLAVPGLVADGRVTSLPGKFPGIEGRSLAAELRRAFSVPAVVVNDAIGYAAGEVLAGAGRGQHRVAVITIGTGVGCAVFEAGHPITDGPLGGGLLGGHLPIADPVGPLDTNGRPGTFEARCCAQRIVDEVREAGGDVTTVAEVYAEVAAGDLAATTGLANYQRWLVRGLVAISHAYTPDLCVVGGGPLTSEAPLLHGVEDAVHAEVWDGVGVVLRRAELGDDAALLGVAAMASA